MKRVPANRLRLALAAAIFAGVIAAGVAQYGYGGYGRRSYYEIPERDIFPGNSFTFCRVQYTSGGGYEGRRGRGGRGGWTTDFPESDLNFSRRLAEQTTIRVNQQEDGTIKHAVVRLTEPDLFNYPFIYMVEVGRLEFSEEERAALRSYLLRGGFLMLDDFWGDAAWENWEYEFTQVLPRDEYPIVEIPLSHEIFRIVFNIKEVPQILSVNGYRYWLETGQTFEPGHDYPSGDTGPHCRGVFDKQGRLICVFMHNTDLGDGWEEESTLEGYFRDFSVRRAYPMGINIITYAMTH